ncbi:insulinase family protein [Rhodoferax sp. AJA081-3]|uniref:insulinase family protein n=1 Tax=Rhodoferax sp. AJA081-3 TaxID=2752316 RepID=UPI001FD75FC6|nr:insulinase family protein [Rhodoferax sp. AJA081-3]
MTDKEATTNALMIRYPVRDAKAVLTLGDYRESLVEGLFGTMLGQRMQELTQQAAPLYWRRQWGGAPGAGIPCLQLQCPAGSPRVGPAVDALVQENERARQFGFSAAELERSKRA